MRDGAQKLGRVTLLLQGIVGSTGAEDGDALKLHLKAVSLRADKFARSGQRGADAQRILKGGLVHLCLIDDQLQIVEVGSVVYLDKSDIL